MPNQEGVSDDSTASSDLQAETSVAVYESYFFNGQKRFFNLFGNFEAQISNNQENDQYYAIVSPYAYSSIVAGRSYTQEAFLSSGLWFSTNWNHDSLDQLFPTIRYQTTTSLIYLDAYQESIENAQTIMRNNPNVTIVVRGYPTEESTDIVDIDLREYVGSGDYFIPENFTGTLVRYTSEASLIIDAPLADALQPGVSLINLSISFIPNNTSSGEGQVEVAAQGLVANSITEATISNLTLNIGTTNGIKLTGSATSNFGLIAGGIASTSLDGITIHNGATYLDGTPNATGISSGTALLAVGDEKINSDINVGLIAGSFAQNSTVRITTVDGIKFEGFPKSDNGSNFNLLSVTSEGDINVGGYFGQVTKDTQNGALDLRINIYDINDISYSSPNSTSSQSPYASINVTGGSGSKINMGGYFGSASGLNRLGIHNDEQINTNITLFANSSNKSIDSINTGILAGSVTSSTMNSTNMQGSDIYGHLKIASGVTINTLNAGGLIGSMTKSANLSYSNANSVKFEVVAVSSASDATGNYSKLSDLNRNNFTRNDDGVYSYGTVASRVNVGDANVGGLVGYLEGSAFTANGLSVNNQAMGISTNTESTNGYSFRLNATGSVNTGSIAGYVRSSSTLRISGTVQTATYFDVVSNHQDGIISIGGAVGNVDNATSVAIGDNSNGYLYSGAAFVNANKINYGGTVGYSNNSSLSVTRNLTAGVLKVYGSNSEGGTVNAGGFIGNINAGSTTLSGNVAIGDVFIEYDDSSMQNEVNNPSSLQTLSIYYFGGLIGVINTDTNGNATITAQNNATLFSNHNARYNDNKGTVGALFGSNVTNKSDANATINGNYYSHGVNLTSEDQSDDQTAYGTDLGYSEAYTNNGGYGSTQGGNILTSGTGSIYDNKISSSVMQSWLDAYKGLTEDANKGSKLKPITIDSETLTQGTTKFNGMTYYYLDRNTQFTNYLKMAENNTTLSNIAIIGNGMVYTGNAYSATLIDSLTGFSYISSMSVDVDIDLTDNGGGLVNKMYDNSMAYAVQVRGTLEATGTNSISIGGIVGTMYSGKIYDSSTNLTLVYRAGNGNNEYNTGVIANANVYGITCTNDTLAEGKTSQNTDKYIVNTYATGKIQTMIDTNIYAFANTTDKTLINGTYTITKIDWNDYTTASKMTIADSNGTILAYGGSGTISNSYYDLNALNLAASDMGAVTYKTENGKERDTTAERGSLKILFNIPVTGNDNSMSLSNLSSEFTSDIWFNSGYPTLKYGFMKISSLATAEYNYKIGNGADDDELPRESKFANSSSLSGDDKDTYVEETIYTRLANNTKPTASEIANSNFDYYYLIPDYNVLTYLKKIKEPEPDATITDGENIYINNFALTNDIDMSRTTNSVTNASTALLNFVFNDGIFDGQSYTIDNLEQPLYHAIGLSDVAEKKDEEGNITTVVQDYTTIVKNLRITNAKVSNAGILAAGQITNATISNITLSGSVEELYIIKAGEGDNSYNQYITVGALAPFAIDNYIFAVTNMATISTTQSPTVSDTENQKTNYGISIGGLIGTSLRNKFIFSSNYGNINVTSTSLTNSNSSNRSINVGGIAGLVAGGSISYSYNAASVLNNYATANASTLATKAGYFYTGGIVGLAANASGYPKINYTYNSGIVKAGNKSNGVTTFKDEEGKELKTPTINGKSYAGGIVGYSAEAETTVDNSYNYGTVEALGKNGEYGFYWGKANNVDSLIIRQDSIKNVFAYAIGYNITATNVGSSSINYNDTNNSNIYVNNVFANGAYLKQDTIIYNMPLSDIKKKMTKEFNWFNTATYDNRTFADTFYVTYVYGMQSSYRFKLEIDALTYTDDAPLDSLTDDEVCVLSYNSYGMPTSFFIKVGYKISIELKAVFTLGQMWFMGLGLNQGLALADYRRKTNNAWNNTDYTDLYTIQGYDYPTLNVPTAEYNNYNNGANAMSNQYLYAQGSEYFKTEAKVNTSSQPTDIRNKIYANNDTPAESSVDIAGNGYYLADTNNINALLNAGIASATGTFVSTTLPYINDINAYKITVTSSDGATYENVEAYITSITPLDGDGGGVSIEYLCYAEANGEMALSGNYQITIECKYQNDFTIDSDLFDFVYINENAMGIKINSVMQGEYSLEIGNVLREEGTLSKTTDNTTNTYSTVVQLQSSENEIIYLGWDGVNKVLVYMPNAYLDGQLVNEFKIGDESVNVITFDNAESFINIFNNKTFQMYIATSETENVALSFNQGGSNSYQFTGEDLPGSESENIELSYGASQSLDSSSTSSIKNDSVSIIVKPTLNSAESVTNDIEFNGSVIATYDNENSVWQVSPNTISYTYNDQVYEISLSAIDGGIQMSIANLNAIDDDTLNALIIDIQSKTTSQTSTIGQITSNKDVTLTYEYTLNPVDNFDSIGVYNNTAVLAYDYDASGSTWVIDESAIKSLEIFKNTGLSVQLAGNKLTFSVTGDSSTIDNTKTTIENFMSSIDMYYEDFTDTKTYENGTAITSKTIISTKDNYDDFSVQYTVQSYLDGISETDNNRLSITGDSTITVSLNEDNIDISDGGYTLNGINVRVGTVQTEISKELEWKLTRTDSVEGETAPSGSGYIEITGENDKEIIHSIQSLNQGLGENMPIIKADDNIVTSIYTSAAVTNQDTGDYAVTLQNNDLKDIITNGSMYVELSSIPNGNLDSIIGLTINGIVANFGGSTNSEGYITGGNYILFKPTNPTSEEDGSVNTTITVSLLDTIMPNSNLYDQGIELGSFSIRIYKDGQITYSYSSKFNNTGEENIMFNEFTIDQDGGLVEGEAYVGVYDGENYKIGDHILTEAYLNMSYNSQEEKSEYEITTERPEGTAGTDYEIIYMFDDNGTNRYFKLTDLNENINGDENIYYYYQTSEDDPIITVELNSILRNELFHIAESLVVDYSGNTNIFNLAIKFSDNKLLVDENYNILSHFGKIPSLDLNEDEENIEIEYNTHAVRNKYELRDVNYPDHSNQIYNLGYASKDKEKFEISIKQGENEVAENELLYQINGSDLTIKMPNISNVDLDVKVTINKTNKTHEQEAYLNGATPQKAQPIILTQDIRLQSLTAMSLTSNVSIIGNDYYLAYYGSSLFTSTNGTSNFIKDLSLLVENNHLSQNTGSLFSQYNENSDITIKNISIYGSLINFGYYLSSNSTDETTIAVIATNATLDNIKTYLNVDAKYGLSGSSYQDIQLYLFASAVGHEDGSSTKISTAYNYGFISVPNGLDGKDGQTATSYSASPTAGGAGTAGKDIKAYKGNVSGYTVNNKGVLRAGDGGNAGAGGSTYYVLGTDGVIKNSITNTIHTSSVNPANPGDNGKGGGETSSGFTGNVISVDGSTASKGVRGRDPFGNLILMDTTTYWDSTGSKRSLTVRFSTDKNFLVLTVATQSPGYNPGTWEYHNDTGAEYGYFGVAWIRVDKNNGSTYLQSIMGLLFCSASASENNTYTMTVPQPNGGNNTDEISKGYSYYQFALDEKGNVKVADNDKYN